MLIIFNLNLLYLFHFSFPFHRQRKLEEALLFSGQFKDAVQALIDWLEKSKKILSENQLLHGDLDTVMALVDQHKVFIISF